jgi:hypothetical protein
MPHQNLGGHWQLAGSLQSADTWDRRSQCNRPSSDGRTIDALSARISFAETSQFVISKLTLMTSLSQKVHLHDAQITGKTDTHDLEQISLTFQKIESITPEAVSMAGWMTGKQVQAGISTKGISTKGNTYDLQLSVLPGAACH